ncbi:hypothetical protein CTI12_AA294010 [Artemisia annua]|uniref:Uncharacterized protein n=1 Tax=Artemisia annua TaxID=35608 RepID=A0A2U1NA84_ARTAN|nr:hypothetical protein CTI12_AA294010 [Artemisia annua]
MKINGVTLILVVLLAFVLISSEGRNLLQANTGAQNSQQTQNSNRKGGTLPPGTKGQWGGCWGCWNKRRLLTTWSEQGDRYM